jgi:hypothetical protein
LVKFVEIWYILSRFGILYQEKSSNPVSQSQKLPVRQKSHSPIWLSMHLYCATKGKLKHFSLEVFAENCLKSHKIVIITSPPRYTITALHI